jgi:hypothetical protein
MNFGVINYYYCTLSSLDFILMKLESSAASERQEIAFSSIVYIELKIKRLLKRTTKAKILAS